MKIRLTIPKLLHATVEKDEHGEANTRIGQIFVENALGKRTYIHYLSDISL
jgi:hypothetical protein